MIASNARSGPFPLPPRAGDVNWPKGSSLSPQTGLLLIHFGTFLWLMIFGDAVAGLRWWGSAGAVLRSQGSSGRIEPWRYAPEFRLFASNARSGPLPLPLRAGDVNWPKGSRLSPQTGLLLIHFGTFLWLMICGDAVAGLRWWGSAGAVLRSQGSSGRIEPWRCAPEFRLFASNARSEPLPLPPCAGDVTQEREESSRWGGAETLG